MKETFEEAAFKLFPRLILDPYNPMDDDNEEYRDIWIEGAKWEQENSNVNTLHFEIDALKRLVKTLEHQQERMYSEEDMLKCWNAAYIDALAIDEETYKPLFFEDFIEQFKKK
jgi:hypothetical protein